MFVAFSNSLKCATLFSINIHWYSSKKRESLDGVFGGELIKHAHL
jgi:hypothetical protein